MTAADAETTGDAAAAEHARHAAGRAKAGQMIAAVKAEYGAEDARNRMMAVAEWREFIREPLCRTREEMRSRGLLPPALPPDIELEGSAVHLPGVMAITWQCARVPSCEQ
jgi:hypothetical protein